MNYNLLNPQLQLWPVVSRVRKSLLEADAVCARVGRWAADTLSTFDGETPISTWHEEEQARLLREIKAAGCLVEPPLYFDWATESELAEGIVDKVTAAVNELFDGINVPGF